MPGDTNPADLFTKILTKQPLEKHRKFVLNLAGDTGMERTPAVPVRLPPTPRPRVRGKARRELWHRGGGRRPRSGSQEPRLSCRDHRVIPPIPDVTIG